MKNSTYSLSWVCAVLGASSPISLALLAPALPVIAKAISATPKEVQISTAIYLYVFGVSQLFVYVIVYKFGEKISLKIGSVLYLLATLLIFVYNKIEILYVVRALQALATSIIVISSRAVIRKKIDKDFISRAFFISGVTFSLSPILGPILSAFATTNWGWYSPFFLQIFFGVIFLILSVSAVPSTEKVKFQTTVRSGLKFIFLDKYFLKYSFVASLAFAGIFSFTVLGPFIFEQDLHLPSYAYGYIAPLSAVGYLMISIMNLIMPGLIIFNKPFHFGIGFLLLSSLILLFFVFLAEATFLLEAFVFSAFLWNAGCALIFPPSFTKCLSKFHQDASKAVSVFGFLQFIISSIATSIVSLVVFKPIFTLSFAFTIITFLIVIIYFTNSQEEVHN
ncbi:MULTISPECIES: MFS transporter [unclassified Rahnella]|uniref:MFS transporter n=1 Tax=Yersiniaceae TaxID=1903411 RepID=UPI0012948FDC|nr:MULTISPECIES: MFS transporter [unclassified Rahnella]MCM2446903.1 multidrug effflux MFS transporter [Rahnella sp. CG8]